MSLIEHNCTLYVDQRSFAKNGCFYLLSYYLGVVSILYFVVNTMIFHFVLIICIILLLNLLEINMNTIIL